MKPLLRKEMKLAASPLSYFFLLAAFLTLVPGYPILLGAFFTTLGIFYSFQSTRENNDISYTLLLPVAKADAVKGKFAFVLLLELCSFLVMAVLTLLRMTVLKTATVYTENALMCANLNYLGFALLIYGLFNFIFVRGFFKTAYYFGKPFILYIIIQFLVIFIAEALRHIPGLESLNAFAFSPIAPQLISLLVGVLAFSLLTVFAIRQSIRFFASIDL